MVVYLQLSMSQLRLGYDGSLRVYYKYMYDII